MIKYQFTILRRHRYEMNNLSMKVGVNITELVECYNLFSDRVYLSSPIAFNIAIFAPVCMLCGTPSNLKIVLLYFVKSDFLGTFASAYTLLLALSDISMMLIVILCIFILFGRNVLKQSCVLELTAQFLLTFFTHCSILSIVLLGFDCIYHAKHPMDYGLKMTKKKLYWNCCINLAVFFCCTDFHVNLFWKILPTCCDNVNMLSCPTVNNPSGELPSILCPIQESRRHLKRSSQIRSYTYDCLFRYYYHFLCYLPYVALKFTWFLTDIAKIEKLWFFNYALYYWYCLFFPCSAVNAWIVVCRKKYFKWATVDPRC